MRVAAVDCGTNSIRLLVADLNDDGSAGKGELVEVDRRLEIVRLGQDVDRTGRLAPEALERTFAACARYAAEIARFGAERVRFVATSATRDASNRDEFVHGVESVLGVTPEVVSGAEEAALSYRGATAGIAGAGYPSPYLVVDIGGGSTEFILGGGHSDIDELDSLASASVPLGSVRQTERWLRSDPPTRQQIEEAAADIDARLADAAVELDASIVDSDDRVGGFGDARTVIGLAGSVTTVAAMALDLPEYDRSRVHHAVLPPDTVRDVATRLLSSTIAERLALPFMHPGRADVIVAGALILDRVVTRVGWDSPEGTAPAVLVSEHDILDGMALSLGDDEHAGTV